MIYTIFQILIEFENMKQLQGLTLISMEALNLYIKNYLAIIGSHSINGVAALHTQLLETDVLKDFYELYPKRFKSTRCSSTKSRINSATAIAGCVSLIWTATYSGSYKDGITNTLRLWDAEIPPQDELKYPTIADRRKVEDLTSILYPDDSNYEGLLLRLKQELMIWTILGSKSCIMLKSHFSRASAIMVWLV